MFRSSSFHPSLTKPLSLVPLLFGVLAILSCGGNGSSTSPTPGQANATTVQINLGDAPADWIVAFNMNMGSMTLTNSSGNTVNVLSGSSQMEMRHLMGTMQPLAMANVPPGTYSMAIIGISSANVTYIDPITRQPVQRTMAGMSKTINFNPPVTVGATPMAMNFDLDLAQSVSADAGGNMIFNPVFTMTTYMAGGGQGPQYGGMDHMIGSISSISGSSFTMSMMQGMPSISVATNSSTQFEHMSGLGGMSSGMMVEVDAWMQSDGTLMASRVDSVLSGIRGGMMAQGIVSSITGAPPTQLSMIADNGAGAGMMASFLGTSLQVNITSSTAYSIDSTGVDLSNLPFTPAFNSSTIAKGQRVDPGSTSGMMGGGGMMGGNSAMNAADLTLEQQGMSGTVSSYASGSPAIFTLDLPPDSAFTSITGVSSITIFQQPDTQMRGISSVSNGAGVQVRGLLFFEAGAYKLVATAIMPR